MAKKNNALRASLSYLKERLFPEKNIKKIEKRGKTKSRDFLPTFSKNIALSTASLPKFHPKKRKLEIFASLLIVVTLATTSWVAVSIATNPDTSPVVASNQNSVNSTDANVPEGVDPNQEFERYNGLLADGALNFLLAKNVSVANTYQSEVYLARSKQEQYDFLKVNNGSVFMSWLIQQSIVYLFPQYEASDLEQALAYITNGMYQDYLSSYYSSNATSLIDTIKLQGYSDISDFILRRIRPKAYIYLLLIMKMFEIPSDSLDYSDYSASGVLNSTPFHRIWGLKLSKNFQQFSNSPNTLCSGYDTINATTAPTRDQWLKATSCAYINGDVIYGNKFIRGSGNSPSEIYSGYLGVMSANDNDFIRFCEFVDAQTCADANYNEANDLIAPISSLYSFLNLSNTGFYRGSPSLIGLNSDATVIDGDETYLLPYDDFFLLFRTESMRIADNELFPSADGMTPDISNPQVMPAMYNYIRSKAADLNYLNFCTVSINSAFSETAASTSDNDIKYSIYDTLLPIAINTLCNGALVI